MSHGCTFGGSCDDKVSFIVVVVYEQEHTGTFWMHSNASLLVFGYVYCRAHAILK